MFLRGRGTKDGSHLVLITGGARSGKSHFALEFALQRDFSRRLFVATAVSCDGEMASRIDRHRRSRDRSWQTLEEPLYLPEKLPRRLLRSGTILLFDCLPTFLTNHLLAKSPPSQIKERIVRLLSVLRTPGLMSVVVTNEVGSGLVPENRFGRQFRDLLGEMNKRIASAADEVYLLVAGIPMRLK